MSRYISFALTAPQFLARTKDVTRRLRWERLVAGDILIAVEKGQGLKKGEKVKKLGKIVVVSVRRERLNEMTHRPQYGQAECVREGFPAMVPHDFVAMFCKHNGGTAPDGIITRIEYDYIEE